MTNHTNKQSNIVYINKETQSLMSEHDYKHLSTDQQNKMVKCKDAVLFKTENGEIGQNLLNKIKNGKV